MNTQAMVDGILAECPALSQIKIRVDKKTQQASVIDIIRMVTGKNSNRSSEMLRRLKNEVTAQCVQLRINGKGRETACATAPVCIEIIWELPGKAAKAFRRGAGR